MGKRAAGYIRAPMCGGKDGSKTRKKRKNLGKEMPSDNKFFPVSPFDGTTLLLFIPSRDTKIQFPFHIYSMKWMQSHLLFPLFLFLHTSHSCLKVDNVSTSPLLILLALYSFFRSIIKDSLIDY